MAPHLFKNLRSKFKGSHEATTPDPVPPPPMKPSPPGSQPATSQSSSQSASQSASQPTPQPTSQPVSQPVSQHVSQLASDSASPQPPISTESLQERLWNEAYDQLKSNEPDVVETYEKILSSQLHAGDSTPASQKNDIGQTREERSHQMQELVRLGLEKTAKGASVKQGIEGGLQTATIMKGIVDKAVQASPEASVAWVGVCLALDILSNPITEAGINRRGVSYVVSRMDWYWNLAGLLLDKNRSASSAAGLREELEKHIIQLYKKLLLYQMKSICIYHRNQAVVFLRDMFKLDDWNGQLTDIQDAEVAVRNDSQQYNTEQVKSHLQGIAEAAVSQESKLQDIYSALLAQTTQQTKFQEQQAKFQEQQAKIRKDDNYNKCLHDLRETDPRDNKTRIQETKGGLLKDSYSWILEHADFNRWRTESENRLLWIKGDPGKGKTMLLCGIIDELEKEKTHAMSYFFCQATEPTLRTATAVLRGIVYVLIDQLPSLVSHVPKKYDHVGKQLFEDDAAWGTLSKMLTAMLDDPILDGVTLIIDALDECVTGLPELLDFVCQMSTSASAKWVLSSRNWPDIEEKLGAIESIQLSLELNESSVSSAVRTYIGHKVDQLSREKKYDEKTRQAVLEYLVANSDDTFLWAALVCRELGDPKVRRWHTLAKLHTFPAGLDALYIRMMAQISDSLDADLCKDILATVSVTYRPITLKELTSLAESLEDFKEDLETVKEFIGCCGSFLNIRNDAIYFIHQSAKDFLLNQASDQVLPSGVIHHHHVISSRSIKVMSEALKRDIYGLRELGTLIDEVSPPDPNPLASAEYSCVYWIDHLVHVYPRLGAGLIEHLQDDGTVHVFLREKYLYWLEALSLLGRLPGGISAMGRLRVALVEESGAPQVTKLVSDAYRFILSHGQVIEAAPLQAYASSLVFSPSRSLVREFFGKETPKWISSMPNMDQEWDACLQTLDGHSGAVRAVGFLRNFKENGLVEILASGSSDWTVKLWSVSTGRCIRNLTGHTGTITGVDLACIDDGWRLASSSYDSTIRIWDTEKGTCVRTLSGHVSSVQSVAFSGYSKKVASGGHDQTIKIWNATTGACLLTLEGHGSIVSSVAFLDEDDQRLVSGSNDGTIRIWDTVTGDCVRLLEGNGGSIYSIAISSTLTRRQIASSSADHKIRVWDEETGTCLHTLVGHKRSITSVIYTCIGSEEYLASGSYDQTIKIWDTLKGTCVQTIKGSADTVESLVCLQDRHRIASGAIDGRIRIWNAEIIDDVQVVQKHDSGVACIACSGNGEQIASSAREGDIKIWDTATGSCIRTLPGHTALVTSLLFSRDHQTIASSSSDDTIKIWEISTGACLQTFEGHSGSVKCIALSEDGQHLASGSVDCSVKVWDASTGICLRTFEGHGGSVKAVAFSADTRRLASGSDDDVVKVWDFDTGNCLHTLEGHVFSVLSVTFSGNNQLLASSAGDETIRIWDLATGACMQTINANRVVFDLKFDPTSSSRLCTDLGVLDLDLSSSQPTQEVLEDPHYHGYGLSTDRMWIMKDGKNVLWLPSEYRPRQYAVVGSTIAIGCSSGRALGMQFSATRTAK
ncbi:WD40-repeat-containing domain protein [Ilyonectria sp. MPI-CAGE-AT-0026]|nr:WD40-repeat-containing domain protein [Ilyonectria sp. MPI-CAGE-AT-0026]